MKKGQEFISFMRHRVSQPILIEPAPKDSEWEYILDAASRAADHGNLKPWRFRIYEGDGRQKLGQVYWEHALSEVDTIDESKKEAFIKKAYRAPVILLVYARVQDHPKVPTIEQVMAAAGAAQQTLLGLSALGYGAMWRTGPACFTQKTKKLLGLQENDQIVGLIYVGTSKNAGKPMLDTKLSERLEWIRG